MGVLGQAQHRRNSQRRKCTETPKQEAVQRLDRDTGSMNPSTGTSDEMILSQSNVLIAKRKATLPRCAQTLKTLRRRTQLHRLIQVKNLEEIIMKGYGCVLQWDHTQNCSSKGTNL